MATSKIRLSRDAERFPPEVWKEARRLARLEVRRRVDLQAVMREAGQTFRLPRGISEARAGVRVFSPFREDGKSPGLLLCGDADGGRGGRIVGAKDMSTGETWNLETFAEALWGLDWKATFARLCKLARVSVEDFLPNGNAGKDPKKHAEKSRRATRQARRKAAKEAGEARFRRVLDEPARLPSIYPAPPCVAERWKEGRGATKGATLRMLAEARGWPPQWVEWLFDAGELSWPLLPWNDRRRGVAFRVRYPCFKTGKVQTVGYHQRAANGGGSPRKFWAYCPYTPGREKARTAYQEALTAENKRAPALPFLIGDPLKARRWIIAEGQWDVLTAWGILGGFEGDGLPGVCGLGLRGAGSIMPLFAAYEDNWKRAGAAGVVVFRDNDDAGSSIAPCQSGNGPPRCTFDDRLRAAVGFQRVTMLHVSKPGADLNDLYQESPEIAEPLRQRIKAALSL